MHQMILLFAAQIPLASDTLLCELYDKAHISPLASTQAALKTDAGIVFNMLYLREYNIGASSRTMLLNGCLGGCLPVLCKFTQDSEDVVREHKVIAHLASAPAVTGIVGPVQLHSFKAGSRFNSYNGSCIETRHCLTMPIYPATLQQVPKPMVEHAVLACGQSLEAVLQQIHEKGYGHNDIKASNIFLSEKGECILGDFGAAQELGQEVQEATTTHWPGLLENTSLSLYHTSAAIDFFQLTITLMERADVVQLQNRPTPASCRAAISNLKSAELQSFLFGLLQHQE